MTDLEVFFWGAGGGFVGEVLLANKHRMGKIPKHWGTYRYWIFGVVWIVLGGLLALMQGQLLELNTLVAFQLGLTAPLGLTELAGRLPEPSVGRKE
ncbi:hypothetical protein JN535_04775 [Cellulosimicrobium cellulans]|uniref:hypothetical protein n=1 Tax=Cellulosimicrobium cellulans TaxID=1710 RepID=UPI0019629409|nr:hypothetical protein [Cellulosimicrobium cellulans]MBN0039489.1 hypothetical protein [Cellulosimicrobium cellulans]